MQYKQKWTIINFANKSRSTSDMFRVRKGIRYRRRRKKIAVGIVLVTILLILLGGLIFRIAKRTIPEVI